MAAGVNFFNLLVPVFVLPNSPLLNLDKSKQPQHQKPNASSEEPKIQHSNKSDKLVGSLSPSTALVNSQTSTTQSLQNTALKKCVSQLITLLRTKSVMLLLFSNFFIHLVFVGLEVVVPYLAIEYFELNEQTFGIMIAIFGFGLIIVETGVIKLLRLLVDEKKISLAATALAVITSTLVPFTPNLLLLTCSVATLLLWYGLIVSVQWRLKIQ